MSFNDINGGSSAGGVGIGGMGLSRSSRSSSLFLALAAEPEPSTTNSSYSDNQSRNNSPPLSSSSTAGTSQQGGTKNNAISTNNSGFIITSRPKHYFPPTSNTSGTNTTSLPSSSPPIPSSPVYPPSLSHNPSGSSSFRSRRSSPPAPFRLAEGEGGDEISTTTTTTTTSNSYPEAKTTLHLSSSVDAQGRRMVNQYIRLKTIGQGSHGKVWLCAEPSIIREEDEDDDSLQLDEEGSGELHVSIPGSISRRGSSRRHGKGVSRRKHNNNGSDEEDDSVSVTYCAIKSVAREGTGRGKSLRLAKGRKGTGESGPGIGADDKVKREVAIMKRLDHQNVVRLKEVIDDVKSKKVFMVLEFMAGGQIEWQDDEKHPTMTVDEARRTFRDVVLGLEYLHYQGIIHRDIKPANLLWTEDHSVVKISDFGVSHVSEALLRVTPGGTETDDDQALRKTAGSPAFFAPELCHSADYYTNSPSTTIHSNHNHHGNNVTPSLTKEEGANYFSLQMTNTGATTRTSSEANSSPSTPTAPRFPPALISLPPASPSSLRPRTRPIIGKGIDVWALGVTLYCLLFGDTPFMARTEYELYNVIVRESIKIPEKMGKEDAWTGVGSGWEGCGSGEEGREVVDLLRRLLEKDPAKRIGLAEVKKHPWVLRNLSSSPDTWLSSTDPAQSHTVEVTEDDLEHATQERGIPDSSSVPIRNRPGIRRALHAALVRFPAFSRMSKNVDGQEIVGEGKKGRSRSKSNSSTSQSFASELPSRHPSDATTRSSNFSAEYAGVDLRKIISGRGEREISPSRNTPTSPIAGGGRGGRAGWGGGSRTTSRGSESIISSTETTARTSRTELSRGISTSSASNTPSRSIPTHLLPERNDSRTSSPHPSLRSSSPAITSSTSQPIPDSSSAAGRRTFSKLLSRLGSSRSSSSKNSRRASANTSDNEGDGNGSLYLTESRTTVPEEEGMDDRSGSQYESRQTHEVEFEDLPPIIHPSTREGQNIGQYELDNRNGARRGIIDSSEFEYSSADDFDDDDEEDHGEVQEGPPILYSTGIEGWKSGFQNFDVVGVGEGNYYSDEDLVIEKPGKFFVDSESGTDSTPRQANNDQQYRDRFDSISSRSSDQSLSYPHPPHFTRQSSNSPTKNSRGSFGASSTRDGSIRNGITTNGGGGGVERWRPEEGGEQFDDEEDEDEDGTEMFVAFKRKERVASTTVS